MVRPLPTRFADAPALSRRERAGLIALIVLGHCVLVIALVRAFGPVLPHLVDDRALRPALTATVVAEPSPPPSAQDHQAQGAAGAAGRRAKPTQIVAPPAVLPAPAVLAAPVAGTGSEPRAGASAGGEGTGGAASGAGTGSGGAGQGSGAGVSKPVKLSGDLTERDYDRAGRAKRLGTAVIVVLTVGADGRVSACRVHQPSGDPDADAVTCRLATERFRFRPALDADGNPIESVFGWQQRFFWK
jgi:protein TonB